ncbi:hypothetical protein DPMN_142116 [Dreissena polymorpha]|uniref:Uncharacterized protein n=1 Tax=Dreissena polymorpha TaxID=45954 RepID=A0A9D4JIC4_DREPO|nr:hypothetical protein DPMN_142116 [Dreissena polymorpha]
MGLLNYERITGYYVVQALSRRRLENVLIARDSTVRLSPSRWHHLPKSRRHLTNLRLHSYSWTTLDH